MHDFLKGITLVICLLCLNVNGYELEDSGYQIFSNEYLPLGYGSAECPSPYPIEDPFLGYTTVYENSSTELFYYYPPALENGVLLFAPSLNARIGKGKSYHHGYASIEAFLSYFKPSSGNSLIMDIDVLRVGEGRFAMNSLIGLRSFSSDYEKMIGAYICYDHRHLFGGDINQFGLGAEFIGECWDLRVNGYIPFKRRKVFLDSERFDYAGGFFAIENRYASAMWGLDIELAKRVFTSCCFELEVGIGPYFYGAVCCNSLVGGMGRISSSLWNKLFLEFYTSYDHYFGFIAQGQVSLYVPFSTACNWWQCIFKPIYRNRVIVVEGISCWETNF